MTILLKGQRHMRLLNSETISCDLLYALGHNDDKLNLFAIFFANKITGLIVLIYFHRFVEFVSDNLTRPVFFLLKVETKIHLNSPNISLETESLS